jgi:hypothetical protein
MYEIAFDTRRTKELEQDNHQLISRTPSPPWYEQQQKRVDRCDQSASSLGETQ